MEIKTKQVDVPEIKEYHKKFQEFFINDNDRNKQFYKHKNNKLDTAKYNIFTFLPKALLFQFFKIVNFYFLAVSMIQVTKISPLSPLTCAAFGLVITIALIREAIEDSARHKFDKEMNREKVNIYHDKEFKANKSSKICVGDIIQVKKNEAFPADLVLLDSNLNEGISYIETATLDGEKSLKLKLAHKSTAGFFNNLTQQQNELNKKQGSVLLSENLIDNLKSANENGSKDGFLCTGKFTCDPPNFDLYKLDGRLEICLTDSTKSDIRELNIPIDSKQLLLKGAILRNCEWVIGFAVYTGHNTKLIINSKKPKLKFTKVQRLLNRVLIIVFIAQALLCATASILNSYYFHTYVKFNRFMPQIQITSAIDSFLVYFSFMVLLNTMIPISLVITSEIVKSYQGYFISRDIEMYSRVRKQYVKAVSVSVSDELGQVNYILSDKTGTLTCNKMEFKYCVIGDECYEYNKQELNNKKAESERENPTLERILVKEDLNIRKIGPNFMADYISSGNANKNKYENYKIKSKKYPNKTILPMHSEEAVIDEFWKCLATAHECSAMEKYNGVEYSALSQDDIELVKAASEQGYKLMNSPFTDKLRVKIGNTMQEFEILRLIEFTSDRKRLSIIIRDGNLIKLYIKGADFEIRKRLGVLSGEEFLSNSQFYVDHFSRKGLRTLFIAMKILDIEEYLEFNEKLKIAELDLDNKHESVNAVYDEIEQDLYLLGSTVVEDKLQDEVPETVRDLRLAGIKVWMLTGDKMETAVNIGLSCSLITDMSQIYTISGEKGDDLSKLPDLKLIELKKEDFSIIIDGVALGNILMSDLETTKFLNVACKASTVICSRISPLQKADVVKILKKHDTFSITLSIGDGGNDVPMIMEGHIGIGVYGEEGMRAVQASDFAIGEFKILKRLLFFHGRTNLIRFSEMIMYFFYKNFVFTIIQFYFGFFSNFSALSVLDEWFCTLFNVFFTAMPLIARALLEHDIKPEDGKVVVKMAPFLYLENRDQPIFTKSSLLINGIIRGLLIGVMNYFFVFASMSYYPTDGNGTIPDLYFLSVNVNTNVILLITFKLLISTRYWTWITVFSVLGTSWFFYAGYCTIMNTWLAFKSVGTFYTAFTNGRLYLNMFLIVITSGLCDYAIYSISILFTSSLNYTLLKLRAEYGILNDFSTMPDNIKREIRKYELYENKDGISLSKLPIINYAEIDKKVHENREQVYFDNRNYEYNGNFNKS